MSDNNFKPAPRERNSLDNAKFKLETRNEKGQKASLGLELVGNNPRLTIYTGMPDDQDNNFGRLQAKLNIVVFNLMLNVLEELATKPGGSIIYSLDNNVPKWKDKKPTGEMFAANTLKIGRDEDGRIWMAVIERNRPKIKFYMTTDLYHSLKNPDGTDLAAGEVSRLYTLAWVGAVRMAAGPCYDRHYVHPAKRDGQGGGSAGSGQGGNRNWGNNNSGGNRPYNGGGGSKPAEASFEESSDDIWA